MSTLVSTAPRTLHGILAAAVLAAAVSFTVAPSAHAEGKEVSKEVFEKYNPATEAFKQHNYAKAVSLAKEGLAVSRSSFEKTACLKVIVAAAVAGGTSSYPEAISAIAQLTNSEGVSASEKLGYHKTLSQLYGATNHFDRATSELKEYMQGSGGGSAADWDALARYYGVQKDCPNAMQALDKALGGRPGSEDQLKLQAGCYFKMKANDKWQVASEERLHRFPKADAYQQVLGIYQEKKIDDLAMLEMLRYGFERDFLKDEVDYVKLASLALDSGGAAEAQRVLEKGIAKKAVKNTDKAARLLNEAKDTAVKDKAAIAQADAEARAGKNGDSDVKLGMRYFGMFQYDKASEALARGLSTDRVARVKRPDDANMVLGMSLVKLKKKADAEKAFNAAKSDARMASVAKLWLSAI